MSISIQDIKEVRKQSGASLADCKRALQESETIAEAVEMAKRFATEREQSESLQEQSLEAKRIENRQAAQEKKNKISALSREYKLYLHEVEGFYNETNGDWAAITKMAAQLSKEQESERAKQEEIRRKKEIDPNWFIETSFRSDLTLSGSSKITIEFDCVQEARISFALDLKTGEMTELRNWHHYLLMPGESPDDPDPLGCWWIYSEDKRIEMAMQVSGFNELYVEGKTSSPSDHPEVLAIEKEITNVVVRDLWIMKYRV